LAQSASASFRLLSETRTMNREGARRCASRTSGSRKDADALCAKLKAAGGACIVLRNPRD
jgi:hypothetical protein